MNNYTILVPGQFIGGSKFDISRHNPTASPWLSGPGLIEQANKWAEIQRTFQEAEAAMSLKGALDQVGAQLSPGQKAVFEYHLVDQRYVIDKISTPSTSGDSNWKVTFGKEEPSSGSVILQGQARTECPVPGKESVTTGFVVGDGSSGNSRLWLDNRSAPDPTSGSPQAGLIAPVVESRSVDAGSKAVGPPSSPETQKSGRTNWPVGMPGRLP